ncbi:MAG: hypothetical protein GY842_13230 [bacterium]|nr:hypothetical protein [bacterium]
MFTRAMIALLTFNIAAGALAATKEPPLPEPKEGRGAIGVSLQGRSKRAFAVQAYFVRVGDGEDPFSAENVIFSNYSRNGQIYLLNAKPGRYFAVAAKRCYVQFNINIMINTGSSNVSGTPMERRVYFSEEMILQTETIVSPGTLTFMGEYEVNTSTRKKKKPFGRVQAHYHQLISPGVVGRRSSAGALARQEEHRGELRSAARDLNSEFMFWTQAQSQVFGEEPAWLELVRRQLDSLRERRRAAQSAGSN